MVFNAIFNNISVISCLLLKYIETFFLKPLFIWLNFDGSVKYNVHATIQHICFLVKKMINAFWEMSNL
jgi:hypothetical protein